MRLLASVTRHLVWSPLVLVSDTKGQKERKPFQRTYRTAVRTTFTLCVSKLARRPCWRPYLRETARAFLWETESSVKIDVLLGVPFANLSPCSLC
ncbi:uncharacterized protein CYBJADRAFT_41852 [Cyberlindnera jadinii NRRL Y-1542]|uniref:Uncharacterized protein n=1 Tax=Cyberlindnera jadinii (strain ATCC 18201 / CBS 1600 / BCRC 20928 / JCM 3617 / NBRC 0987 / NRRL Y-1542) TaxID=983966 RepID=A0A1E4S6R5_CYBJN|nr:hypothetical protein CYBJADRAFT_41852 [Cyberlindnera jadinii NRRL Y-1542]ODV75211.1 hypothetical protein CYBJADRAFT_41852 [Cyberlindnera jadinii NRRL Y-1542]